MSLFQKDSTMIYIYFFFCAANIFGIGDCTNVPTSKTASACAAESAVIKKNLFAIMRGETPQVRVSMWIPYVSGVLIFVKSQTKPSELIFMVLNFVTANLINECSVGTAPTING